MKFNPRVSLSRRTLHCSIERAPRPDEHWVIHIEHITREKVNANVGIHPSKIDVTKLRMDKGSKSLLDRKAKGCATADKEKGTKFAPEDIMETVN
ncbi:60S ribosomal protein L26-1 [Glycine soja]|uniref:60S ribosomal protein L26-1 n=1 Tax=Glycine soja TaxID=3848 RepID=A0A0B2RH25_GLYSO|nr:60S ribosomal protein L26-1 [Glycine soja]